MTEKQQAECTIESDGTGVFVVFEGVRIAKRGESAPETASESSTPAHLLRVEEAGSLAPSLLTFRLAF